MASAGDRHDDEMVAALAAAGWRSGRLISSTMFLPGDDRQVAVMVTPDPEGTEYSVDIGPREQRWYESRTELLTAVRMRTRHAGEALAVLRALGHLPEQAP